MRAIFLVSFLLFPLAPAHGQKFSNPDTLAPDFPTPQIVVERMLSMADVKASDTVYDLGCGDGRILITAVRMFRCRAVGVELSRDIYERTSMRIRALGLADRISIIHGNALHTDISHADVVTLYLLTSSNERLRPQLEHYLKPGARVVSHDFEIHGWKPSKEESMRVDGRTHSIFLYVVKPKS